VGAIAKIQPSRNFIDGEFFHHIDIAGSNGPVRLEEIFCTDRLTAHMKPGVSGAFYFWNSHCYGFKADGDEVEDIAGARRSYFARDSRLLIIMAASVILLPAAAFIVLKKLLRAGSAERMQRFLSS
jgi:hypothetical protein